VQIGVSAEAHPQQQPHHGRRCQSFGSRGAAVQVITSFGLGGNKISDEGARALAAAVEASASLIHLDLGSGVGITNDGAKALAAAVIKSNSMRHLELGDNQIGDEGAEALAVTIQTSTTLREVHLGGNEITDVGAKALALAVEGGTSLAELDLSNNHITDEGADALAAAVLASRTFEEPVLITMEDFSQCYDAFRLAGRLRIPRQQMLAFAGAVECRSAQGVPVTHMVRVDGDHAICARVLRFMLRR